VAELLRVKFAPLLDVAAAVAADGGGEERRFALPAAANARPKRVRRAVAEAAAALSQMSADVRRGYLWRWLEVVSVEAVGEELLLQWLLALSEQD